MSVKMFKMFFNSHTDMFDEKAITDFTLLSGGIKQFKAQMKMPLTQTQLHQFFIKLPTDFS